MSGVGPKCRPLGQWRQRIECRALRASANRIPTDARIAEFVVEPDDVIVDDTGQFEKGLGLASGRDTGPVVVRGPPGAIEVFDRVDRLPFEGDLDSGTFVGHNVVAEELGIVSRNENEVSLERALDGGE
mgnify:CR=1 FL=1